MNELNLTPTQSITLIIICLFFLILLLRYESYIELDITPKTYRVEGNTATHVKERYGAYISFSNKDYN